MSKRGMLWASEELELLKAEINAGKSLEEITQLLQRTPYGVVSKMHQMGWIILVGQAYHLIKPEPWTLLALVKAEQEKFLGENKK